MSNVNTAAICLCCLFSPEAVPETQDSNGKLSDKCTISLNRAACACPSHRAEKKSSTFQVEKQTVGDG